MRRRVAALAVVLATLVACPVIVVPADAASATAPTSAPALQVSGNKLVDETTGRTFVPHGVNYPGFEYACEEGWGYSQGTETQANADAMVAWHINIVRIPLNEDCWLEHGSTGATNYGSVAGYQSAVQGWVTMLNDDGIAVILDLHYSSPSGKSVGQYPMADARSVTFWSQVAAAYQSDPSVMFDAFNEPYSIRSGDTETFDLTWTCWEDGGCQAPNVGEDQQSDDDGTYTVAGMQELVTAIRSSGATQPIMLGGIDYSNDLTGWLSHEPTDPDGQLVASWHNYPGQDCDTVTCWNSEIAPVAAVVPVVAGEFGETDGGTSFLTTFMNWADANGLGYLPWAWWDADGVSGDALRYALYAGSNFTPQKPEGTTYYAHLQSLPTSPPSLTTVGTGGGVVPGGPPIAPSLRRPTTPAPAREGPSERRADGAASLTSLTSSATGADELAAILATAPRLASARLCVYG